MSFGDFGLSEWLVASLAKLSIVTPSEIQRECIPKILAGQDVIASAKTGSGKTAAFALPILQSLSQDPYGIYCLVLTPTRELAFQIAEQFRVLGKNLNLRQNVVVGGMDMMTQGIELSKKPHIVVATPGRLVDHILNNTGVFNRIKFLVLDEVDRLLDASFASDLELILSKLPKSRQTLLFSATMTPEIKNLTFSGTKPFVHECAARYDTVDKLDQKYLFIPSSVREVYLAHVLRNLLLDKTLIIFINKSKTCEYLRVLLKEIGIRSTALHSQMSQSDRLGSLAKFKTGIVNVLVATDIGSRGLDIPTVQAVINFELPADAADYIHRVGRTARAGRGGLALSFVTERDIDLLQNIEKRSGKVLSECPIEEKEVLELLNEVNDAKRIAIMHLTDTRFGEKAKINKAKLDPLSHSRKPKHSSDSSNKSRKESKESI